MGGGAMDGGRWQRVKEVFSAALEKDAAERDPWLDLACANDPELRAEVDSLIAAHGETGDFIERPAAQDALSMSADADPPAWIGRRVGDYRVVEEVGRGGMSEVYKAVRDDDEYHKEVAVKVLRRGYDTKFLLRRFKVETQILATLDHPNIARLLDAGSTEEGLPYLVMDFIQGRPVDDYCRHHRLSLRGRLDLFRQLCSAVQYVHQHLMVHGDLKCSNVLVSSTGHVKLLDFGIARLLNPSSSPLPNLAEQRLTGFVAMTPEYASPEQIRGGPITTSSDVYSLGVVLYQLLTGVLPYRLRGDFSYELAAQIVEREAAAPSVAAKGSETNESTGFGRQLRGDLDNIVLMALEKDPARRYSSVEKLDDDIRRHLEGFPVAARSASSFYRAGKFAGRHKAGIAAVLLIVATLAGGAFATLRQARIAVEEGARAQRHFDEVRKLANVFMFDVDGAIQSLPGATPARQMLIENSLRYLETLSAESGNEASLQRELASSYEKVADVQGGFRMSNLGDTEGAISSYPKALALRESLAAAHPQDRDIRRELLRNYGKLGEILAGEGDTQGGLEQTRKAAKLAQQLVTMPGATIMDRRNMGTTLLSLGWQQARAGQVGDGVFFMRQAIAMYKAMSEEAPHEMLIRRSLALAYGRLGEALITGTSNFEEALDAHRSGFEIADRLFQDDPRNADSIKVLAYARLGMGSALFHLNRPREALAEQLKAAGMVRALLDADARNEMARFDTAFAMNEVGTTLIALGELKAAEQQLTEAMQVLSQSEGISGPALTDAKVLLGLDQFRLGLTHALRANQPDTSRPDRNHECRQAAHWFKLGEPTLVMAAAAKNSEWRTQTTTALERMARESDACTRAAPVQPTKVRAGG